ncbi:Nuclear receptor coactivator 7 [Branchiostoma belcheri]|nr:Nuclear receptor coactivator 7 [Branchiostoma belcheri]
MAAALYHNSNIQPQNRGFNNFLRCSYSVISQEHFDPTDTAVFGRVRSPSAGVRRTSQGLPYDRTDVLRRLDAAMATRMASREQKEEGELAASRKRRMFDLSRYRGMLQRGGNKQPGRFSQSVDMSGGPSVLPWETAGSEVGDRGKDWEAAKDKPQDYPRKLSLDSQDVAKSPHEKKGARRTRSLPKPKGTSEYVVQKSDSLAGIALQFDTTPSELARLNKLPTRMVFPGMMLYVPDPDAWTDEETSVSSSPASPPASPPTEIPSRRFDLPVVREKEPSAPEPGHVTSPAQVVTPSSSRQSSLDELGSQKEDEFHEQFLKINVKYITAGKGTVSGVLLVTPNAIMFDPHKSDPLVIETGCEEYGLICQMDTVLSAAMYHDIRPMMEQEHKRDEIYKSGDYSQDEAEPTSSSRSSCHGNGKASLPGQRSESLEDEVFGGGNGGARQQQTAVEVAQLVDLGDAESDPVAAQGSEVAAEGSNVPKPQKFVEELVPIIEEKVDPNRLSPRVLSPDAGIDEETDAGKAVGGKGTDGKETAADQNLMRGKLSVGEKTTDGKETAADQVRKSGCSDASDTGSVESGIAEMVEANQKDTVRPADNGAITTSDTLTGTGAAATSLSRGETDLDPATDLLGLAGNGNGIVQESINFVDFSCGLFTTEANRSGVQDISEAIPEDFGVQQEIAELKDASKLLPSSEDVPGQRKEGATEDRVRERPTFLPSLTGSFDELLLSQPQNTITHVITDNELLPSQPQSLNSPQGPPSQLEHNNPRYDPCLCPTELLPSQPQSLNFPQGPPLFLCLKVMQMKKSFTGGKEVVNPGSTKLPEYWFAIPRTADHLYAFFLQWSPDVYGHEVNKDDLEVSGFVVLGEETDSLEVVDDFYSAESSLYKDWEIVTAMEARRRLSMLEVEDSLPQPTLLGKSNLLDSKHVSQPTLLGKSNLLDSKHISQVNSDLPPFTLTLTHKHFSQLAQFLPPRTEGYAWMLIYSTFEHGISLTTMYKKMVGVDSPVLLVVQDSDDKVFGALTSSPVKISEHFYGTGESFLFTFFQDFKVYKWTGDNTFFIKGDKDCLAIGGGDGQFGLWLDEMLYHGRTHACTTFNNDLLTSQEDFTIKGLEAWGFEM